MDIQKILKSPKKPPANGKSTDGEGSDVNGVDIISSLPDEILCHILSLLPTKYAVGTCILSTRWKNLFTLIPNLRLRFEDTLLLDRRESSSRSIPKFIYFVDKVLLTLHDVPSVNSFCLIVQKIRDGQLIGSWVRAASYLNVKRMDIRIRRLRKPIFFIDSLYGCNVVSLNLFVDFADESIPYVFSLPNLKMLSVQCMQFNVINPLLESCPLLEFLAVSNCFSHPEKTLRVVNIPSLKAFKVVNLISRFEGEFEINAPNLEYFNYAGILVNNYTATKLKSLRIARLDIYRNLSHYPYGLEEDALGLIKICSNVEKLWISEKLVEMLHQYSHPLPMFRKLVSLAYKNVNSHGWELLPHFIDCAPNLKNVSLKAGFDNESYMRFNASLDKSISICLCQRSGTCYLLEIQREEENGVPSLPSCSAEQTAVEV